MGRPVHFVWHSRIWTLRSDDGRRGQPCRYCSSRSDEPYSLEKSNDKIEGCAIITTIPRRIFRIKVKIGPLVGAWVVKAVKDSFKFTLKAFTEIHLIIGEILFCDNASSVLNFLDDLIGECPPYKTRPGLLPLFFSGFERASAVSWCHLRRTTETLFCFSQTVH